MDIAPRTLVLQPAGLENTLSRAAQDAGAWALVDATRPGWRDQLQGLAPEALALRAELDTPPRADIGMAVLAPWSIDHGDLPRLREAVEAWQAHSVPVAVEVHDRREARRAKEAGCDLLVARGSEGPGRTSARSNLVLLPALAELDLPVIAWGGAGPHATAALLVHAEMVVLDAQLYLLEEAGLSQPWQRALSAFDGTDVRALGSTLDEPVHLHARVADQHVHALWEEEQASDAGLRGKRAWLQGVLSEQLADWSTPPGTGLHPLGADAAHASWFAQHGTLARALATLGQRVDAQLQGFPLTEGSPLAQAHGTRLPVVQGAMANVSEVPAFAKAVSDAGGLPFLAFAALRPHWAEEALTGTKEALGEEPFGCGIIGLDVNAKKRDAHVRLIKEHQPPVALIAAGTAEQALELERAGVDTYMHTPSQGIVRQAAEMGLTRFVVEGSECGGHIGKLPSLVLWDLALQVLDGHEDVQLLLAGGVSDAKSAAMAGVLAGGQPGIASGVLMGTAYLATREIVDTGAITPAYQRLVLASRSTAVTGESVGIRARSAPTPFTDRVQDLERELVRRDEPLSERKHKLEHENLGATRIAARGLKRGDEGAYHEVPQETQLQEGNYLMGQGAELLETTYSIADLHDAVTVHAQARAQEAAERLTRPPTLPRRPEAGASTSDDGVDPRAIAVVGLGCVLPDAHDVDTFWGNLLDGHVSIRELPEGRWPVPSQAHLHDGEDGTYTLLGGFVGEVPFDPIEYRIPPTVAEQMDDSQRWALLAVDQALEDAGLREADGRDRWAVILGNALGGEQRTWTERRLSLRETATQIEREEALDPAAKERVLAILSRQLGELPPITEDTMPGELSNVIAGRVCSVFDIGGPARTVDAACASSLAAVEEAVGLLRDGAVDVAITGGVDRSMDPAAYSKFSAIGALSREGSFPFDERASGFVMGEGCGILVLKRLRDAVEDGDRIYACIHGVGSSSDGKGKGITAPNPAGQVRAIQRALDDAGWDPSTLELIEAHGTGTPVGDPAEAETLMHILSDRPAGSVGLGSVKSNIGHLKAAAGAAGLLKATLAIHHGLQPPTVVDAPTSKVDWAQAPLRLVREPTPWESGHRRAGVSAFGFGGTNSHVLLGAPPIGEPVQPRAGAEGAAAGLRCASGVSPEEVLGLLDQDPATWPWDPQAPVRVALVPGADLEAARKVLTGDLPPDLALSKGVASVAEGDAHPPGAGTGQLALVFPGQGSQYPGMVLDLAERFPAAREVLDTADQVLTPLLGQRLSELLALEGEQGAAALTATEVCQPAVLTCDIAVLRILEELGVEPDVVAGHSLGEYAALVAAGVLSFEDALHAVSARGREMSEVDVGDPGGLVALRADLATVEPLIDGLEAWPANVNGPEQTVVAGTTPALKTLIKRAAEADVQASGLPVSAAFHSPIVAPATEPLSRVLAEIPMDPPQVPVISNVTAKPYPEDPEAIRELLARQVASPVQWVDTLARMDEMGVGLVVEAGPKRVLTGLARANLPGVPAVPTAHPRAGAQATLEQALAVLAVHGHLPIRSTQRATDRQGHARPQAARSPPARGQAEPVRAVVTGVSLGLPGQGDPFDPTGVERLLSGENRIEAVPGAEREQMASMGVTRLIKDAPGGPQLQPITSTDQVVKLAGRAGSVDLPAYDVQEDWLEHADPTARLAVAAALNALTDADIPLVREVRETSTGARLEGRWVLPGPLQGGTGVILASAFPGYASLLETVGDRSEQGTPAAPPGAAGMDAVVGYLADLLPRLESKQDREEALRLLTQLEHRTPPSSSNGHPDEPRGEAAQDPRERQAFPRDFLFRALALGHAQVAQLLRARGPNLQVNAACASTTAALCLAQDWIEQGRCQRVIVVGADVAGNEQLLPWVGAGFLAAGAASTSDQVEQAALPFDQRRHGMLIGSGAVALVVEREDAAQARGKTPLAELVSTHLANSAYHGARLHTDHVAQETRSFLQLACKRLGVDEPALARELVFVSHEPATPARGGSAEAEVRALREALGESAPEVLVTNTKGLTGHAMGAGLEDGIAVELLRHRRAPPVANLRQVDPAFQDLTFSQGGTTERSLSLRFAAGFGSQLALALFHRTSNTPGALDQARFAAWLEDAVGAGARVEVQDRLLRAIRGGTAETVGTTGTTESTETTEVTEDPRRMEPVPVAASVTDGADVVGLLRELISERTGYPEDVIEAEMDLEADLGVDTVKQAEVLAEARRRLNIPPIEGLSLSDVPTLQQAADVLARHTPQGTTEGAKNAETVGTTGTTESTEDPEVTEDSSGPEPVPATAGASNGEGVVGLLRELVSERTGYPEDVIEAEMDLEADLGVDTVKQAEVLAEARRRLNIPPIEGLSLSDVPTLQQAADVLARHIPGGTTEGTETTEDAAGPLTAGTASDPGSQAPGFQVLALGTQQAPPTPALPEGVRVALGERVPEGLSRALEAQGAVMVDEEPDVVLVRVPEVDDAGDLVDMLVDLQGQPPEARLVLVVPGDHLAATGLGPLAATLTAEGRPARAILLEEAVEADQLAREVLTDTDQSVLLSEAARRRPVLTPASRAPARDLPDGAVVLAVGGLGAAVWPCLAALADEHHVRIAVVGRSSAEDPGVDPDDPEAVQALRARLLEEAREEGSVRPAEVEENVQAVLRRARRAQALSALREHAEVRYFRADATDPEALDEAVESIREAWGEPALVVHGAGLERSRAFQDKDRDEMGAVIQAKLAPVLHLTRALPEAHHVAFGSIAGVTGNPGQADYALANGALTGLLDRAGGSVIHWTAWDAAGGMADKESVRTVLEERGIAYLPIDEGTERFLERALVPGATLVADLEPGTPLARDGHGGRLVLTGREPWLADHTVGKRPLLPGVRHLEAMVETASTLGLEASSLSQVRFSRPLWVTQPMEVAIQASADDHQASTQRDGRVHATARLTPDQGVKPLDPPEEEEAWDLEAEAIYQQLFHGPSFQVLEAASVREDRVVAQARLDTGGAAPWALALEACMQAAGLAGDSEQLALPTGIEEVQHSGPIQAPEARLVAQRVGTDLAGSTWDATVWSGDQVVLVARAIRLQQAHVLGQLTDALAELGAAANCRLSGEPVAPHEPRDPRAKRAAEHEAGQRAAQRAVETACGPEAQARVERDDQGRPVVQGAGDQAQVSISHGHGLAVAAASRDGPGLGVDLERIEPRSQAWLEEAFTPEERGLVQDHPLGPETAGTVGWTLKEAAAKALGTGLSVPLHDLQVAELGDGTATVATPEGEVQAWWAVVGGAAVAVARQAGPWVQDP